MSDPWQSSTIMKWLKVTDAKYDKLLAKAQVSHKCVKPGCRTKRTDLQDNLCAVHRAEYNAWTQQFFVTENTKEKETCQK